jgi:hypothetical protein
LCHYIQINPGLTQAFQDTRCNVRAALKISIMAEYALFGANPAFAKHPHIWDPASFQED